MPAPHPLQPQRDQICLAAVENGWEVARLALVIGVTTRTIERWVKRARENPEVTNPGLEYLCNGAGTTCLHGVPLISGMPILCLDCDQTGIPDHPAFRRGAPLATQAKPKDPPKFTPKRPRGKKSLRPL